MRRCSRSILERFPQLLQEPDTTLHVHTFSTIAAFISTVAALRSAHLLRGCSGYLLLLGRANQIARRCVGAGNEADVTVARCPRHISLQPSLSQVRGLVGCVCASFDVLHPHVFVLLACNSTSNCCKMPYCPRCGDVIRGACTKCGLAPVTAAGFGDPSADGTAVVLLVSVVARGIMK